MFEEVHRVRQLEERQKPARRGRRGGARAAAGRRARVLVDDDHVATDTDAVSMLHLHLLLILMPVDWVFKEDEMEDRGSLEEVTFKRLFRAFKPCINGFEYCMHVIHIDGTHLYGPYPDVLLSVVAVDGVSHILPLAFVIVESENVSSWGWFMDRLRRFVAGRRHGICVISDRHAGIIAAMRRTGWCEPLDHHRFYIRHLAKKISTAHRRKGLKNRLVELASQVQEKKFDFIWEQLLIEEPRMAEWFEDKSLSKWSLAYDGGKHFGMMTTNHAKSWNNAILNARKLPISSLVRALFLKTIEYFDERHLEITAEISKGRLFTNHASKRLSRSIVCARGHSVKVYDRNSLLFEVVTRKVDQKSGNRHTVRLPEYLCSCGKRQTYRIPCSHVIAYCAYLKLSHESLVDEIYRLVNVLMVYNGVFESIPSKGDSRWPTGINFPNVIHDKDVEKKKGRRKSTRYQNAMDFQAPKGKNELF
ncbi:uncharacterized protein LOC141719195 [Apium graveolens]|uniref:uncharacterized protein LOC141719195 n=1 Tax=Apium graveolens TaxID=4045 RepID=UPI003D7B8FC8